jgi:hypothetical protein
LKEKYKLRSRNPRLTAVPVRHPSIRKSWYQNSPTVSGSSVVIVRLRTKTKEFVGYVRFEVVTTMTMKNAIFGDVSCVALVRTDVSE